MNFYISQESDTNFSISLSLSKSHYQMYHLNRHIAILFYFNHSLNFVNYLIWY